MKINKHSHKKILLVAVAVIFLLLSGFGYWLYVGRNNSDDQQTAEETNKIDYSPPTHSQKQAGETQKQQSVSNDPQPTPTKIPVTITAANQNGNVVNVRSLIGLLSSEGTCQLTLTKDSSTITKTSSTQALSNSSTCKGFDVATSELSSGTWRIRLVVSIGNRTGLAEKDITIS